LVAGFALAADPSGELVAADEAKKRADFHSKRQQRLEQALLDPSCEAEGRGPAAGTLVNSPHEYGPASAAVLPRLVDERRPQSAQVLARLHRRLLLCQVDEQASGPLVRDVLVPAYLALLNPAPAPMATAAAAKTDKGKSRDKPKDADKDKE